MDLMSLLAKLTLDKEEYDKGLEEAEKEAKDLQIATPSIPKTDNTQFEAGLKEAEETGNMFKEVMSGVWQGVKDAIVTTGILALVSGFIGAMKQGISLAIDGGKTIADNSKNLKLSARAYQEYDYVLGKSNLQVKNLTSTISKLDKIRSGNITDTQKDYFKSLGIDAEKAASGVMSTEQMLDQLMTGLANYEGTDKGAIIEAFFGKSEKWTGYFEQSAEEIKKLKKEADDLGLIMSDETVENAVRFNDATEKLANTLEGIKLSFGEGILPLITEAVEKLEKIIDFFKGGDKSSTEQFTDIDSKYEARIRELQATETSAKTLATILMNMGDTAGMDSTDLAIWKGTAESLIKLIPTLSGVIDVENGTIGESADNISELISKYIELEKETEKQAAKTEKQNVIDEKRNELSDKAVEINNNLANAEAKRNDAIDEYNKVLDKYEIERLGYDATMQDIQDAQDKTLLSLAGNEQGQIDALKELQEAAKPLTEALQAAAQAQAEVDQLKADIAEGEAAMASMYGSAEAGASSASDSVGELASAIEGLPDSKTISIGVAFGGALAMLSNLFSNAKGNWTVPYDNFPALLHRDEMVLTKSQARQYREGNGSGTDVSGAINNAVANAMSKVYVMMNGDKVGDLTTKRVRKNINTRSYNKLRAMGG